MGPLFGIGIGARAVLASGMTEIIAHQPLARFGVEVERDLSVPLDAAERAALKALLYRHGLVVARGQSLSLEQQCDVLSIFGPLLGNRATVSYVAPDDGVFGTQALGFHSDLAFAPLPFDVISLHAVDVADGATSTRFADAGAAYQKLSPSLLARLQGLTGAAVSSSANGRTVGYHIPADAIRFDRAAILQHRITGQPILYVQEAQTARFNELGQAESDALLEALFAILYRPDHLYEHRWTTGDLVIWDNLRLQHARPAFAPGLRRRLQRVVVAERSLLEQVPDFRPGDPDQAETVTTP
jgi:taurine dioxygenase